MRIGRSFHNSAVLNPDGNHDIAADSRLRATRGYSGVGCLKATLLAGIPITTIGCSSAACNITGIDQSVATGAIARRFR